MEVIVLAGGLGTRLRPVLPEIPKCLAPIGCPSSRTSALRTENQAFSCPDTHFSALRTENQAFSCPDTHFSALRTENKVFSCPDTHFSALRTENKAFSCPDLAKPFLEYLLNWLGQYPVEHVVFSVGHLKEQVISFVQSRQWPFEYDFAVEDTPLGTGGGIRLALSKCHSDKVFVVNGDTFFPVDLGAMSFEFPVTLALKPMKDFDRYGSVSVSPTAEKVQVPTAGQNYFSCGSSKNQFFPAIAKPAHDGEQGLTTEKNYFLCSCSKNQFPSAITEPAHVQVTAFHEKAPCKEGLINGGVYAIDRSRVDLEGLPEKFSFEKEVLEPGAALGQVGGCVSNAYFIDIGVPEDYANAQWAIPAYFAVMEASKAVLAAEADTLFLDRDGVLNRHMLGDYVKSWAEWEWMPGILEEFPKWAAKFRDIVLVTNQRGVGKGVMSDEDLAAIHARMMADIIEAGGRIDLILTCTDVNPESPRRKPNIGMYKEACALLDIKNGVMLGDSSSDAAFAANCGMPFILLSPEGAS